MHAIRTWNRIEQTAAGDLQLDELVLEHVVQQLEESPYAARPLRIARASRCARAGVSCFAHFESSIASAAAA